MVWVGGSLFFFCVGDGMYRIEVLNDDAEWVVEDRKVYEKLAEADYQATVNVINYGEICRVTKVVNDNPISS